MSDPVKTILARLDGPAVLLPIPRGKKGPKIKEWEKLTLAVMDDPGYLGRLNHGANIGVLLGQASEGLCTVDLDDAAAANEFFACNPALMKALQTSRVRGRNIWLRIRGEFPEPGGLKRRDDGTKIGEWRANRNQTVIHGEAMDASKGETVPTPYRVVVDGHPPTIEFKDIIWPEGWRLPWEPSPEEIAAAREQELAARHGVAYTTSERGKVTINTMNLVARFAHEHDVLHEADEGTFYSYEPTDGLWKPQTTAFLKIAFATDLKLFADAQQPALGEQIINARNDRFLGSLVSLLQGHTEAREVFGGSKQVIHAQNGMVHLDDFPPRLSPFHAKYLSRNRAPVAYDPMADCPQFKRELLESALDADDVSLVQRYAGSILLKHNAAQRILLLVGTAGGGKSTLVDIFEKIIGVKNVGQLRTKHLADRFEIGRFIGRTLLTGKDVEGNFLELPGASQLKSLVGHDLLDAELKTSNAKFQIRGDFGMVITANTRLHVRLDGDTDAWRRRMIIMSYNRPKPIQRITDFADRLLAEEGAGILGWMIAGTYQHLAELEESGDFKLTPRQRRRVDALLAESDSVREFVRQCVEARDGSDVTVFELVEAYTVFCDHMGWEPLSARQVENALADAMQELMKAARRNGIDRDGKAKRGFANVRLVPFNQKDDAA